MANAYKVVARGAGVGVYLALMMAFFLVMSLVVGDSGRLSDQPGGAAVTLFQTGSEALFGNPAGVYGGRGSLYVQARQPFGLRALTETRLGFARGDLGMGLEVAGGLGYQEFTLIGSLAKELASTLSLGAAIALHCSIHPTIDRLWLPGVKVGINHRLHDRHKASAIWHWWLPSGLPKTYSLHVSRLELGYAYRLRSGLWLAIQVEKRANRRLRSMMDISANFGKFKPTVGIGSGREHLHLGLSYRFKMWLTNLSWSWHQVLGWTPTFGLQKQFAG